jgi:hypothetical protein
LYSLEGDASAAACVRWWRAATLATVCVVLLIQGPATAATRRAAPNFSSSVVSVSPESPLEGDLLTFTLLARNTGPDPAAPAWIVLTWPAGGYFIAVRGLDTPQIDHEQRRVEGYTPLAAGAEHRVELDMLTPRDSGGLNLTLGVRVSHLFSNTDHYDSKTVPVDTRFSASGVSFGGMKFTPAGLAVLGWFAAFPVVWLVVAALLARRRRPGARRFRENPAGITLVLMIPLGFWAFFAAMAWRDYQSLTTWRQTECTVVGRRITEDTISSTTSTASGGSRTRTSTVYSPELALRYVVDGAQVYSSGYDTGSALRVGGRSRREEELRTWTIGTAIPCWYDPADMRDVVVHKGFGGAYLFALIPLPVFVFGLASLRRRAV